VPDDEWGQLVTAVVVANDPSRPLQLDEVRERLRGALPAYALPRRLVTVERLPRDGMGKVGVTVLRELAQGSSRRS
jgi:acyl-CoA synthetase (AMP-forming)/AMP-acid ligase II